MRRLQFSIVAATAMLSLTLQVGAVEPPETGDTAPSAIEIWNMARLRHRDALTELIGMRSARLDRLHDNGFAALHWAANNGRSDAIALLLELGADVNVKQGQYGGTPLQYAAANGDVESIEALVKRMARVDLADNLGRTPLMWAAMGGHDEAVKLLLESGANVNAAMQGGWTPMHYAVQAGDAKTARRLLEAGADLGRKNKLGKMPLEVGPPLELIPTGGAAAEESSSSSSDDFGFRAE